MIDKKNLGRHIIVEKNKDDITNISPVTDTNYRENEVLLNAIGTSIFEFIRDNNILFEGWTDHKLFETALKSGKKENKSFISFFKEFGCTYAQGVKDIKNITPVFKLTDKKFYYFTDSDEAAINAKDAFARDKGYQYKHWVTYEDLGGKKNETLEDYVSDDLLNAALKSINREDINLNNNFSHLPVMKYLANCLSKDEKEKFKNYVIVNIDTKYIKDSYFICLKKLKEIIEAEDAKE